MWMNHFSYNTHRFQLVCLSVCCKLARYLNEKTLMKSRKLLKRISLYCDIFTARVILEAFYCYICRKTLNILTAITKSNALRNINKRETWPPWLPQASNTPDRIQWLMIMKRSHKSNINIFSLSRDCDWFRPLTSQRAVNVSPVPVWEVGGGCTPLPRV